MIKIYQLKPEKKVFEAFYGEFFREKHGKKIYTLEGYLWLLEKVIEDFSQNNPDKKREVIFNSVFKFLDTKVSDWIEEIYKRGRKVGKEKLEKYMAIADKLEEVTNGIPGDFNRFNKLKRRKIREREMGVMGSRLIGREVAAKYEEAIRVPMNISQLEYCFEGALTD